MEQFMQVLIAGIAMGAVYAIIALSFVLLYNSGQALNFALGEFVMIGAFIDITFYKILGLNPWLSILLTCIIMTAIGFLYEKSVFHPLRNRSPLNFAIATVGVGIFLKNLALIIWGADPRGMRPVLGATHFKVFGISISSQHVFIGLITILLLISLYLLFFRTRLGRKMRATAQNSTMAQMLGVNTNNILGGTFAVATLLAGLAGWLLAPVVFVYPEMGGSFLIKSFIAVVIGGFGSLQGAVAGGLLFGIVEVMVATYISSTYRDVFSFAVLLLVLLIAPQGLFGEAIAEKV